MEATVIEVKEHAFQGTDGVIVKGVYFYLKQTDESGAVSTERQFVQENRMREFAYSPKKGDKVLVFKSGGKVVDFLKA